MSDPAGESATVETVGEPGLATIILATHNRAGLLRNALAALARLTLPNGLRVELVVVDNASNDDTRQVIERFASTAPWRVRYAYAPVPGISRARNLGVTTARGQWILFTDDDIEPQPDWLARVVEAFKAEAADGVCGAIVPRWETTPPSWAQPLGHGVLALVDYGPTRFVIADGRHQFIGANMAYSAQALRSLGSFREDLGLMGRRPMRGGETELFERALAAGKRLVYEPAAIVRHWVPRQRLTKRYFRQWRYWAGYSTARYHASTEVSGRRVLGLPLWVVRESLQLAASAVGLYVRGRTVEGLERELRIFGLLGYGRGLIELEAAHSPVAHSAGAGQERA
jgi:glycosyltransferase involved in cell wall biosynthesis